MQYVLTKQKTCSTIKAVQQKDGAAMKYLRDDLRVEYDRLSKECPDIDGLSGPRMINVSDTLRAYFILADYFTDPTSGNEVEHMLVGLRSYDLLASALGRQAVGFGGEKKYTKDMDVCATLFFGMVKNHAFADGNKRTALLILLYQLNLCGLIPVAPVDEYEKLVVAVAANSLSEEYPDVWSKYDTKEDREVHVISNLLRKMVSKKDNTYHIDITAREFCRALEELGVVCVASGGKIHFTYIPQSKWDVYCDEKNYAIPFGGWTRVIGPQTARETMQQLGLYQQLPSYQSLLDGASPMYQLVQQFEVPLRRLKDE